MALNTGLVSYYKCDVSGSFSDAVGTLNGTIYGATFNASGKINGCQSFDGVNDGVQTGNYTLTDNFTFNVWMKANKVQGTLFYRQTSSSSSTLDSYLQIAGAGTLAARVYSNTGTSYDLITDGTYNDDTWHMVTLVHDASAQKLILYVDGSFVKETNTTATLRKLTIPFEFGKRFYDGYSTFGGLQDEIGIWNRALSSTEVSELYNNGTGMTYVGNNFVAGDSTLASTVAYYKCDTSGSFPDVSGNRNNGTINGASFVNDGKVNHAYSFDGTNDTVTFGSISGSIQAFSLWVKPTSPILNTDVGPGLMQFTTSNNYSGIWFGNFTGSINNEMITLLGGSSNNYFYWDSIALGTSTITVEHHFIAITWEASNNNYRLYYDGNDKGLASKFNNPVQQTNWDSLKLGTRTTTYFNGTIDEFGIYNTELLSTDVSDLYNSGVGTTLHNGEFIPGDDLRVGNICYYKCDTNGSFTDATGNGNDGTINGATYTSNGKINGGYNFDGINDYINTNSNSFNSPNGAISFWFNSEDVSKTSFLIGDRTSSGDYLQIFTQSGSVGFRIYSSGSAHTIQTGNILSTNTDYFIVLTWGNEGMKLFLNNSKIGDDTYSGYWSQNSNMQIGQVPAYAGTYNYYGIQDEIGIWNRALSPTEIATLYNSNNGKQYPYLAPVNVNLIIFGLEMAKVNGVSFVKMNNI